MSTWANATEKERESAPEEIFAGPGRSYPIADAEDLHKAIQSFGRSSDPATTKRGIIRRAKALGKTTLLPEDWGGAKRAAEPSRALLTKIVKAAVAGGWADELPDGWHDPDGDGDDDTTAAGDTDHDFVKREAGERRFAMHPATMDDHHRAMHDHAVALGADCGTACPAYGGTQMTESARHRVFAGKRHSGADQDRVQAIHDHAAALLSGPRADLTTGDPGATWPMRSGQMLYAEDGAGRHALCAALPAWFTEATAPPPWIPYMPAPHTFQHPAYGEVALTPERNREFVLNFNNHVYQDQVQLDAEHQTKLSGALGWIRELRLNEDQSVDARVDWTPRGETLFANKAFRYVSPEWYDEWTDPGSGTTHTNVAIGGALTGRPFFKPGYLRPLAASEHGPDTRPVTGKGDDGMTDTVVTPAQFSELSDKFSGLEKQFTEVVGERDAYKAATERLEGENKTLAERIGKMETDARTKRFSEIAARIPGDHAKTVTRLTKVAERFGEDSEEFTDEVAALDQLATRMKESGIFAQRGTSNGGAAIDEFDAAVARVAGERKIAKERATVVVMEEQPELYARYQRRFNERLGAVAHPVPA